MKFIFIPILFAVLVGSFDLYMYIHHPIPGNVDLGYLRSLHPGSGGGDSLGYSYSVGDNKVIETWRRDWGRSAIIDVVRTTEWSDK